MKVKYLLVVAIIIGGLVSFFASAWPDGLERVAADQNFSEQAVSWWSGLIADYVFPGISNQFLANFLAGVIGVLAVYLFIFGILMLFKKLSILIIKDNTSK